MYLSFHAFQPVVIAPAPLKTFSFMHDKSNGNCKFD